MNWDKEFEEHRVVMVVYELGRQFGRLEGYSECKKDVGVARKKRKKN